MGVFPLDVPHDGGVLPSDVGEFPYFAESGAIKLTGSIRIASRMNSIFPSDVEPTPRQRSVLPNDLRSSRRNSALPHDIGKSLIR